MRDLVLPQNLRDYCENEIRRGSKSFSLASRFFGRDVQTAVFAVYAWCRHCDDAIDRANSRKEQLQQLEELERQTRDAYAGTATSHPVFRSFQWVVHRYEIPQHYPLELLEGMRMDTQGFVYQSWNDLNLYCYRVAGVVGLMMTHIMGLRSESALKNASDLGCAMQLTNIARDVGEDLSLGRVYLPAEWLLEEGLDQNTLKIGIGHEAESQKVLRVVKRMLDQADALYASGVQGLPALHWRAALAVSVAQSVYREIGQLIRKQNARAWNQRTVVSVTRKGICVMTGLLRLLKTVPVRFRSPWQSVKIQQVWRGTP